MTTPWVLLCLGAVTSSVSKVPGSLLSFVFPHRQVSHHARVAHTHTPDHLGSLAGHFLAKITSFWFVSHINVKRWFKEHFQCVAQKMILPLYHQLPIVFCPAISSPLPHSANHKAQSYNILHSSHKQNNLLSWKPCYWHFLTPASPQLPTSWSILASTPLHTVNTHPRRDM